MKDHLLEMLSMKFIITSLLFFLLNAYPSQKSALVSMTTPTKRILYSSIKSTIDCEDVGRKFIDEKDWIGIYKGKLNGGEVALVIRKTVSEGWNMAMQDNVRKIYYENDFKQLPFDGTSKNKLKNVSLHSSKSQMVIDELTMNINNIDFIHGTISFDRKRVQFYCIRK